MRAAGCDRANFNATDANTFVLTLDDPSPPSLSLTNGSAMMGGQWVKGTHAATYSFSEYGSGIRFERLYVDGSERWGIDHIAAAQCNRDAWGGVGEFARNWAACPNTGGTARSHALNTATLPDGAHTLRVCAQDYAQWQGLAGTGGQSCVERQIRTDNNAPGAPTNLSVVSANSERYLPSFGASFGLPPNSGSPITKVHHNVVDASGAVVRSAQTVTATNPTALADLDGPAASGPYRLRVWLEDEVGNVGPAATAEIPRDTTPPAAPQALQVAAPAASRSAEGFDLRWRNISDAGYRFAIAAGPSRQLSVAYRPDQRQLSASATIRTEVKPTLRARRQVIRTGQLARLEGEIPGPRNDDVVIVLQVRQGKGWLAFRRYRTRAGGRFIADYLFRRTSRPTTYVMRAQVRETGGYPYLQGSSDPIYLRVLPARTGAHAARCGKGRSRSTPPSAGPSRWSRRSPPMRLASPGRRPTNAASVCAAPTFTCTTVSLSRPRSTSGRSAPPPTASR